MSATRLRGITLIYAMLLLASSVLGCSSDSVSSEPDDGERVIGNDGPEGSSGLTWRDTRYPLNAAIGDIWGVAGDHYHVDFTLTDGNFTVETLADEPGYHLLVPAHASAVFRLEMFSPGDKFDFADYVYVSSENITSALAGVSFFTNAYVGLDTNQDGMVSPDEQRKVVDGTVLFTGALPDIELQFQVILADGEFASGEYTGLFDFTER